MLEKFRLTPRQWKSVGKWTLYAVLFLTVMMVQTVCLGNVRFFGASLSLLPIVCCCICLKESPNNGGVFVLIASLIWCLSGADSGSLAILLWTSLSVLGGVLCQALLNNRFFSCALCSFVTLLVSESVCFLGKFWFGGTQADQYLAKVLPSVLLSMLFYPILYLLTRSISRIGGNYGTES